MTLDQFRTACVNAMHPLHTAQIATMFHCSIDELITDAYTGEIDDLNDSTPDAFIDWVDSTYNQLVN